MSSKTIGLCRVKGTYTMGETRQATVEETELGLGAKLLEECGEVIQAPRDVSEYADVLQVLQDYAETNGIMWCAVLVTQEEKAKEKGGFLDQDGLGKIWSNFR